MVAFGARSMAQASSCRFRAWSRAKRRGEGEGRLSLRGRRMAVARWLAAPRSFWLKEVMMTCRCKAWSRANRRGEGEGRLS
jgi:hypothetical protein